MGGKRISRAEGSKIKSLLHAGASQREIAREIGRTESGISRWLARRGLSGSHGSPGERASKPGLDFEITLRGPQGAISGRVGARQAAEIAGLLVGSVQNGGRHG